MAYVTLTDIQDAAPQITLSGDSRPTEAVVTKWIGEVEASLSASLSNMGYTLPITAQDHPASFTLVQDLVVHGVIAKVLNARLWGVGNVDQSGAKTAQMYYDDRLKWLKDPNHPYELPDAARNSGGVTKPHGWNFGSFVEDTTVDSDDRPRATMDQVF